MNTQPLQHIPPAAPGILNSPVRSGLTDSPTEHTSGQRKKGTVGVNAPNIIIYGATGAGKSSIINLIAGQKLAHTSNDTLGCTFQHQRYIVLLNGTSYALWDTIGLDEVTDEAVSARLAKGNLRVLIRELAHSEGIHLIIYCIRATRLTKPLKRNYDPFYATFFRKKVSVALVVTGLGRQQGEMETWWNENEAALQQYGMRFGAHACVTTLDVEDHGIQQRRLHSQRLLRELVVRYSKFPAWKTGPSFISSVLPMFRTAFRRTMVAGRTKKNTTIRRVINCDMVSISNTSAPVPIESSSDILLWETRTECVRIEGRSYEFVYVDKRALEMHTLHVQHAEPMGVGSGAGVLVFYTSPLGNAVIPPDEVSMLEVFHDIVGGHVCPMIVVLRGCDNEERATRECQSILASRHKNIQAYFTTLSNQQLNEMIGRLCIEHVKVKSPTVYRAYTATKGCDCFRSGHRWTTSILDGNMASNPYAGVGATT